MGKITAVRAAFMAAAQQERDKLYQGAAASLADALEAVEALAQETPQARLQARAAKQALIALRVLRATVGALEALEAQEPPRAQGRKKLRAQRASAARLDQETEALEQAVKRAEAWRDREAEVEAELRAANRRRAKEASRVVKPGQRDKAAAQAKAGARSSRSAR